MDLQPEVWVEPEMDEYPATYAIPTATGRI